MKRILKRLFSSLFTSTLLLSPSALFSGEVSTNRSDLGFFIAADPTVVQSGGQSTVGLYKLSSDGSVTKLQSNIFPQVTNYSFNAGDFAVDEANGKIYFKEGARAGGGNMRYRKYDIDTNTFEGFIELTNLPSGANPINIGVINKLNNTIEKKCTSEDNDCNDAGDSKFVNVGGEDMEIKITEEGMTVGQDNLIKRQDDGTIHIGKNSLITTNEEKNGVQPLYATDATGKRIPIDIQGSRLLINGRDVEQSINNVGALSAALTALPAVPTDTTLSCGFGSGTHGGDIAFSGGCASKVNEKLSLNYAASIIMPGQKYGGDFEDSFSAKAGFIWKLGKATKPTQISMKETNELKKEISDLKNNNNQIISQNKNLQLENQSIISQNKALLARLERLEKIALGDLKLKDLAVYKLK